MEQRSNMDSLARLQTAQVTRGVRRWFAAAGQVSLPEFGLPDGRRADVLALDTAGWITLVEVKVSIADFRGDRKWPGYAAYCDRFCFAVPEDFPQELIAPECGLIVADGFDAVLLRPPPEHRLAPPRRKALVLEFGRVAAQRLHLLEDEGVASGWRSAAAI
ncbi:hypothetical protein E9232_002116 [Inquilinus ginsengisoli]|uniref:DNA repair protein MmcB-related protein n=1 Tax=Inquilinus ginsengisoli TaxID=363840 RepID=A0ABU1JLV7_9PROT|nr:MmcB family DNA repair protein [Inquilinus ginsengisoli]MDR6289601.1 hypothetical protein [Inquilinus ginsengisoli]